MARYRAISTLTVALQRDSEKIPVGRLAVNNGVVYFEYAPSFIETGIELSPFRLPLERGLKTFNPMTFDGLPGLFYDSLPDGWGRLLADRMLISQGIVPAELSELDRLCMVGKCGMGALIYEPAYEDRAPDNNIDLDALAADSEAVLSGASDEVLDELIRLNGSSHGARPKAMIGVNQDKTHTIAGAVSQLPDGFEHWLVKFPNQYDGADAGAIEYAYSIMAKEAGVHMPETHLFPSKRGAGFFAVKRFDRIAPNPSKGEPVRRVHMHTAAAMLHSNFRIPALDYENLLALCKALTRDLREVEKLFRIAVFNVLAHNRDDHGKNVAFTMNASGEWFSAPAYDLTFSSGPGGWQSTTVLGEGRNPGIAQLRELGKKAELKSAKIKEIIDKTQEAISRWPELAGTYGVSGTNSKLIQDRIIG